MREAIDLIKPVENEIEMLLSHGLIKLVEDSRLHAFLGYNIKAFEHLNSDLTN